MTFDPNVQDDRYPDPMTRAWLAAINAYCKVATGPAVSAEGVLAEWVFAFVAAARTDLPALVAAYEEAVRLLRIFADFAEASHWMDRRDADWWQQTVTVDAQRTVVITWGDLRAAAAIVREFEGQG